MTPDGTTNEGFGERRRSTPATPPAWAPERWIRALLLIPLLGGCGSDTPEPPERVHAMDTAYGYLVIQEQAARWWGFATGDTVAERPPDAVPSLVQQAARTAVAEHLRWEKPCYRYFRNQANYVVLVDAGCPYAGWDDGRILMGITPAGEHLAPAWTLDGRHVVERICPGDRDSSGREMRGNGQSGQCIVLPAREPSP